MEPLEDRLNSDYLGPPQRWAINFSNGLEYVNSVKSLLKGEVRIFNTQVSTISPGSFEWDQLGEFKYSPTVRFYLHSLKWLDQLIEDALSAGTTAESSRDLALEVAEEWWSKSKTHVWDDDEYVWGGHGFALRATTLTALSELAPEAQWLREAIEFHGVKLVLDFDGFWNHGLVQALALICVAGRLADDDALDIGAVRARDCLRVMVDEEGCINEQAPEYSRYIERLLRVTIKVFTLNQLDGTSELDAKKEKLRAFIAHSLKPDGTFIELGDSAPRSPSLILDSPIEYVLSHGNSGKPIPDVAIYKGGFIFGRSGFGSRRPAKDESYYSARFGPQRIIHGHNDHTSITYWSANRPVIVDPGHIGYTPGPERSYVRSHEAHNVLEIRGARHDWSTHTSLVSAEVHEHWQAYAFQDEGYSGYLRDRAAMFADCGPFVVLDRVTQEENATQRYFVQRWNISPEFEFQSSDSERVSFVAPRDGMKLTLIRYLIGGTNGLHGQTSLDLNRGDRIGFKGLVAQDESLAPCWNVGFGYSGKSALILTAGFLSAAGQDFGWSFRPTEDSRAMLRIHVGADSWAIVADLENCRLVGHSIPAAPQPYGSFLAKSPD